MCGSKLRLEDQLEHYEYAKAGFVVVAFEVDGSLQNPDNPTIDDVRQAYEEYNQAAAGLTNVRQAAGYAAMH